MGPYLLTFVYFIVAVITVLIGLYIFELITSKYKDWDEIENGNTAVALSIGGKIIGICIILSFSIYHSSDVLDTIIWGAYGVLLQLIAYYLFDFMTRKFSVEEKLKQGNIAVGIASMSVSIGLAFVVGASIT
ncbi:DUF350 domain-containing protein [Pseudalkalibacillus caeni]|uniref:DUF350 domain-containing protein n=1 Tax=Exobacillus caeni TaxID=2574798 RepID=A0A5R9F7V8_9BACL|nr:DUF350 domain-containing protein [Pseudalkalibacillus caeni]TLS39121.1 DUF350 domain-containing protein [Pseudalkalibacillus caeni]